MSAAHDARADRDDRRGRARDRERVDHARAWLEVAVPLTDGHGCSSRPTSLGNTGFSYQYLISMLVMRLLSRSRFGVSSHDGTARNRRSAATGWGRRQRTAPARVRHHRDEAAAQASSDATKLRALIENRTRSLPRCRMICARR